MKQEKGSLTIVSAKQTPNTLYTENSLLDLPVKTLLVSLPEQLQ